MPASARLNGVHRGPLVLRILADQVIDRRGGCVTEIERLRMAATRALAECCDDCRALLREQLRYEERGEPWPHIDPEAHE